MLSGKVAWGRANGTSANCYPNPMDPCSSGPSIGGPRLASVNYNHTFSPTTLLSVSLGLTRNYQDRPGVTGDFPDYNYIEELGLPSYMTESGLNAAPTIYLNSYASPACCGNFGGQGWGIMKYAREAHHLIGNLSQVRGRHELKFGGEMRLHRINFRQAGYPGSLEVFQNNSTSKEPWSGGGDPMAGFLIGYPGYGSWGGVELPLYVSTVAWKYAGFVQDNWRVTDKMTLNLGVRYDVEMPRTERYNRMSYLDANAAAVINPPGITLKGAPFFTTPDQRTQYDTDANNFAPRIGIAYQFSPKTVMRGGYGIFYVPSKVGAAGTGPGGNLGIPAQHTVAEHRSADRPVSVSVRLAPQPRSVGRHVLSDRGPAQLQLQSGPGSVAARFVPGGPRLTSKPGASACSGNSPGGRCSRPPTSASAEFICRGAAPMG